MIADAKKKIALLIVKQKCYPTSLKCKLVMNKINTNPEAIIRMSSVFFFRLVLRIISKSRLGTSNELKTVIWINHPWPCNVFLHKIVKRSNKVTFYCFDLRFIFIMYLAGVSAARTNYIFIIEKLAVNYLS